ncbi:MAG: low specificity L-threonine aldolase, partial [Clostridia bacterium]|nr:low specificity L-threonine aldolase [Clostridia bacterium]
MISFESDYITGAHPEILNKLAETNLESLPGYGADKYCESAKLKIAAACCRNVDVELLTGGTQTNAIVIAALLKDYEGVIAAQTGHINAHEAGAVEYAGHKVLPIPGVNGKLDAAAVDKYAAGFYSDASREHMVFPGMVYVSYPTEYGTLYTKRELTDIAAVCRKYDMKLFLDGARLAYGLMSRECDLSLGDLCDLCDVFYIGGTKAGALCGEAVVFTKQNKPPHFLNFIKKRGALLAKGRLPGVQFDALFTDDLYFRIGLHGIRMAEKLRSVLSRHGAQYYVDSPTNQTFVIADRAMMQKLEGNIRVDLWEKLDEERTVVR